MSTSVLDQMDGAHTAGPIDGGVRAAVVDAAIELYRRRAIDEVTVEDAAAAAGLDRAAVQEQFPSIRELLLSTIEVWHGRRNAALLSVATDLGAVAYLRAVVVANVAEPALMRLLMGAASIGAAPGHPMGPVLRQQWVQFHATVQRALAQDIAIGREPSTVEPPHGAEQLIAVYEGLQVQSLLRPNMDLLESYDRAVTRLREGWASTYTPSVWEI
jgi:AcrR family transcriptional regulator